jgi:tRNA (adenine-N(1)-)-methyltransferase non-catalytic subunit
VSKSNNKEIYSGEISQKLSEEEIKNLKEQGIKGEDLIKLIMESNESTKKRTLMSQEKIMKKKDKRHNFKIWIQEINLFNLMETFFEIDLKKIK